MLAWWESLSSFSQVLAAMAIPATLILLIQTVLMLIGIGSDGGADVDGDVDVDTDVDIDTDVDLDADADVGDGVFGEELTDGDIDPQDLTGCASSRYEASSHFLWCSAGQVLRWIPQVLHLLSRRLWPLPQALE